MTGTGRVCSDDKMSRTSRPGCDADWRLKEEAQGSGSKRGCSGRRIVSNRAGATLCLSFLYTVQFRSSRGPHPCIRWAIHSDVELYSRVITALGARVGDHHAISQRYYNSRRAHGRSAIQQQRQSKRTGSATTLLRTILPPLPYERETAVDRTTDPGSDIDRV